MNVKDVGKGDTCILVVATVSVPSVRASSGYNGRINWPIGCSRCLTSIPAP